MHRFSRWHFRFLSVAALALASWSTTGEAAGVVPSGITQQGRVLDADGNPVTTEVAMTFTIYDDPMASEVANVLWTEVLNIQLDDGYFSARIGEDGDNAFPAGLFDGSVRYLGVTVGTDAELAPRARLASVPYAFIAGDAVGDIHPLTVTVGGKQVINKKGEWIGNAVDRPFSGLLSIVTGTKINMAALSGTIATATCGADQYVTGGGCIAASTDSSADGHYTSALKESYPSIAPGALAPNRWNCRCFGSEDTCDVTAYSVCVKN